MESLCIYRSIDVLFIWNNCFVGACVGASKLGAMSKNKCWEIGPQL